LAAHNAQGFDRFGAEQLGFQSAGWVDTSQLARIAGLPGALADLSARLGVAEKDKAASRFTTSLSTCRRPTHINAKEWATLDASQKHVQGTQAAYTPEAAATVEPYCALDVLVLVEAWPTLSWWAQFDVDVRHVDAIVNDRGICLDSDLVRALLQCDAENAHASVAEVAAELGWTADRVTKAARSPVQFCEATGLPDAQKATLEGCAHPLARARGALASIARGKLEAGLAHVSADGRLRDTHLYYGAHTGRWSGRGMQLQNLPRPAKALEDLKVDAICAGADACKAGHLATQDEIDVLLRACLTASSGNTLVVCDFTGVEARALAWVAVDQRALDAFSAYDAKTGANPYSIMGAHVFGVPVEQAKKGTYEYNIGKILELACGYGQGAAKFVETAYKMGRVRLDPVQAKEAVRAWRQLHAPIVALWAAVEKAWRDACYGVCSKVGPFEFAPFGQGLAVILPSGRPVVYNAPRICADSSLEFLGTRGREYTYGGKLVENLIQAMCRCLMADSLVRAEAAGLCPVMHCHDEIACDVPASAGREAYDFLHNLMVTLPSWALGFPIGAAGWFGPRYHK
jgi:DNA polymerase